jgi:tryptophan-rich sensory protein
MNMKKRLPYIICAVIALAVGGLSALLSMNGMEMYTDNLLKPPLSPPAWIFPVVWTILYVLMGIGAARIWMLPESETRSRGLNLYVTQLIVNFFWSLIFFNAQAYGFAVIWLLLLWGLVLWMILQWRKIDPIAALLQIPYLIWLTFAAYLNIGVWILN